jgi:hypothetical protein
MAALYEESHHFVETGNEFPENLCVTEFGVADFLGNTELVAFDFSGRSFQGPKFLQISRQLGTLVNFVLKTIVDTRQYLQYQNVAIQWSSSAMEFALSDSLRTPPEELPLDPYTGSITIIGVRGPTSSQPKLVPTCRLRKPPG